MGQFTVDVKKFKKETSSTYGLYDAHLPPVTDADNGKTINVKDGKWKPSEEESFVETVNVEVPAYTNQISLAGFQSGDLSSSGELTENANLYVTGFIPVTKGDIIRVKDPGRSIFDTTLCFALYKTQAGSANIGKTVSAISTNEQYGSIVIDGDTLIWDTSNVSYYFWNNFAYFRATVHSSDAIVTVNDSYYSTDGTHLSEPGRTIFGRFIGGSLITYGG